MTQNGYPTSLQPLLQAEEHICLTELATKSFHDVCSRFAVGDVSLHFVDIYLADYLRLRPVASVHMEAQHMFGNSLYEIKPSAKAL